MTAKENVRSRQVRLGLVLYGGVSLAVYENGVAQELYRAFRKQGIYKLICDVIQSDILIDIISGASAGGVNGIMLAYALANGTDFKPSAQLWSEKACIEGLLGNSPRQDAPQSVLNSEYYLRELSKCFAQTLRGTVTDPVEELDLFIAGTDANGAISTVFDEAGHPIDIKNHRTLFRLKHRQGRDFSDFDPRGRGRAEAIATLSRLTSCFPVAFEPVPAPGLCPELVAWGKLPDDRKPAAVFLDGGILNNKPFTSTIDAIASRTAEGDVERFLIYVEPDPERFVHRDCAPSPSVLKAAVDSLLAVPRYQSIAADLEAIQAHNERADRILKILDAIGPSGAAVPPEGPPDPFPDSVESVYKTCRLMLLRDTAVEALLNERDGKRKYLPVNSPERRSARLLVESFSHWDESDGSDTLREYDLFFRKRRVEHLSRAMMREQKKGAASSRPPAVWDLVNHYFKLYEIVENDLVGALTTVDGWDGLADAPRYAAVQSGKEDDRNTALAQIAAEHWGRLKAAMDARLLRRINIPACSVDGRLQFREELTDVPVRSSVNILDAIDKALDDDLRSLADAQLLREFYGFLDVDRQIFPLRTGSGFESMTPIRVVRFSPLDAQRSLSKGEVSTKVRGLALGAFGGFLKETWRRNDLRMGRLDAACQLIECLLTKERLASTGKDGLEQFIRQNADNAYLSQPLVSAIQNYLDLGDTATHKDWCGLIDILVAACHQEIHKEEGFQPTTPDDLPDGFLKDVAVKAAGRLGQALVNSEPTDKCRNRMKTNPLYWVTFRAAYRIYAGWHKVSCWFGG